MAEVDRQWPAAGRATVKDYVDHIDYAVKLIGIDHVGIASDFDGGGGVEGWNSAAETFNVTLELVRRGYTEEQIAKTGAGICCGSGARSRMLPQGFGRRVAAELSTRLLSTDSSTINSPRRRGVSHGTTLASFRAHTHFP